MGLDLSRPYRGLIHHARTTTQRSAKMDTSINPGTTTQSHPHTHMEGFQHWIEGVHIQFPTFKHDHPAIIDVNKAADEQLTVGQRIADGVAATMGSWRFIIIQSCILVAWLILNSIALINH